MANSLSFSFLKVSVSRFNLEHSCWADPPKSLQEADLIGVLHDISNIYTRECLDIKVIKMLERHSEKPSVLVLNKVSFTILTKICI